MLFAVAEPNASMRGALMASMPGARIAADGWPDLADGLLGHVEHKRQSRYSVAVVLALP